MVRIVKLTALCLWPMALTAALLAAAFRKPSRTVVAVLADLEADEPLAVPHHDRLAAAYAWN